MAYTWTNKTKTGGVGLTGKIVQKGKDDFPLMYANDLDWANVEVENGVNLNTTDDLLDYIKGSNHTIIGRIDELELSNVGYEIRCDKSVCYVGDTIGQGYQNQKLPVSIYKNGTLLSWTDAYTDGITFDSDNFTKPSGGNDLIHWSTSDCYLSGTANKVGTYVFNFKRNGVSIASYTLTVLLSSYKSTLVVVYTSSNTDSTDAPQRPTSGRYDFDALDNNLQDIEPWQTSVEGLSGVIWFCTGYVSQETPDNIAWGEPNLYLSKLGTPGTNWKITTLSEGNILVPVMYARSGLATPSSNDDCLTISPNYIRSYKLENQSSLANDSWRIQRNGEAYFAKGQAVFNSTGAFHIGGQNGQTHTVEANGTTSLITDGYIDYNPISGTLQIGGLNISITGVDYALIGANVTNSLSGDQLFIGLVASQAGVSVIGSLNTKDLSVGDGSCFFKGTDNDEPEVNHGVSYAAHQLGAGHLAKGNIWWDADGNLSIGGQLRLKGTSLEWGGSVQQYELLETDFSHNAISGENGRHYSHGALYKLPDPMEYEGREILVEVYATGDLLASILGDGTSSHMPVELNGANRGGYDCLRIPCFTIDSNNWKHKWIKWGVDACKYNSCEISHLPKFYILGEPGMYDGTQNFGGGLSQHHPVVTNPTAADRNTRNNVANDLFNLFSSFGITSPGATDSQIEDAADAALSDALSNSATIRCNRRGGLYLIPTAHKWQQMFDYSRNRGWGTNDPVNHESDTVVLRMKCLAKKVRYSGDSDDAWYYWEVQTTDFIPFFDTAILSMNGAGVMSDYVDGSRPYDITASEFYNTYEKAIASSLLAFDDNFNVPNMPSSSFSGGQLTV